MMRLLQLHADGSISSTEYFGEIPPYAILSHTWGTDEEEVTFKDLNDGLGKNKKGYSKLSFCGKQAALDGLEHFWVDTCCIDKSSSAELSEAINSMFKWYQNAKMCYVYLSDVATEDIDDEHSTSRWKSAYRKSRWFTRGWTLQELLAPNEVRFYSKDGNLLGDKLSLQKTISEITGIALEALRGGPLYQFSVEERLSWSRSRITKREEDAAYCLLGIFDVHMALLYGEGQHKALARLQRKLTDGFGNVHANDSAGSAPRDAKLSMLRKWLAAPDPATNYQQALKQRQANTGLWLLESEQYSRWRTSAPSFLWLYGIPGSGKTILSSTILQHVTNACRDQVNVAVAYFYFDFNDSQKQLSESMLRSLIHQFVDQSVQNSLKLDDMYTTHDQGRRQPSPETLKSTLRQLMQEFNQAYIILDALDECTQRAELIDVIGTLVQWQLHNSHVLVTSRRESDLEGALSSHGNRKNSICLESEVVDDDIRRYVQQRLSDDKSLSKWSKDISLRKEIESALMHGSQGMFRWAVCQLDMLKKCRNRASLRKSLAKLPPTLDRTYDRILSSISEDDTAYAIRILRWLTFAERPLTLEELAVVVAIDEKRDPYFDAEEVLEDPLDVLEICSGLVSVATDVASESLGFNKQIAMLAHYSVKEYLLSGRCRTGQAARYYMHAQLCHSMMAKACLNYLLQFRDAVPLAGKAFQYRKLARYAAEFWMSHAEQSADHATEIAEVALELFSLDNPAYLNWLRTFDPERPWNEPDLTKSLEDVAQPLYYAALFGFSQIMESLIDQGADVNAQSGQYGNALQAASGGGHEQSVKLLLARGVDVNTKSPSCGNALQAASEGGHEQVVKLLLDSGADVNAQGGPYGSALESAIGNDHLAIVERLLAAGADIAIANYDGWTPLIYAADKGYQEIVTKLLEHGANVEVATHDGWTALNCASDRGHLGIVKVLIENNANLLKASNNGWTPLISASDSGHLDIVKLLLDRGANTAVVNNDGWTPLIAAANKGHLDVVKWLAQSPATNLNSRSSVGQNALFRAAANNYLEIVEYLLAIGADPGFEDDYGETAASRAASCGHNSVLQHLLAAMCTEINSRDRYGRTLLWWAAACGRVNTVRLLTLQYSSNPSIVDDCGRTPLMVALKKGHTVMSKLLANAGAHDQSNDVQTPTTASSDEQSNILCDICTVRTLSTDFHYHCTVCTNGNWDICAECRRFGLTCMDESHVLTKRIMKDGIWIDVQ